MFGVVLGGGIRQRTCSANGVWSALPIQADGNDEVFTASAAAMPDGRLHVVGIPDVS